MKNKCICNEGIHNGKEVDCACECHYPFSDSQDLEENEVKNYVESEIE